MKRILIAAVLCAGAAFAEDPVMKKWHTCEMTNGFFWKDMAAEGTHAQEVFLIGFIDGDRDKTPENTMWPTGAKVGEIKASLKLFYDDPENLPIPIPLAIAITKFRLGGKASAEPDAYLPGFREYSRTCKWPDDKQSSAPAPARRSLSGS